MHGLNVSVILPGKMVSAFHRSKKLDHLVTSANKFNIRHNMQLPLKLKVANCLIVMYIMPVSHKK